MCYLAPFLPGLAKDNDASKIFIKVLPPYFQQFTNQTSLHKANLFIVILLCKTANVIFKGYLFVNFIEKNLSQVFDIFHVLILQSFEFDVSDVIPANVQNISPLLFLHTFVDFMENEPSKNFCGFLIIFHEVMKLQSVE